MALELFDCTLRDGGSVVGGGVTVDVMRTIAEGLVANGLKNIEIGNTFSMGAKGHAKCAPGTPTDDEYLKAAAPLLKKANFGMFFNPKFGTDADLEKAKAGGLGFIRIGANVGETAATKDSIAKARSLGLEARFSLMKSWAASAEKLAEDAKAVEGYGAQIIHLMDSTGSFLPDETAKCCETVRKAVKARVGFHGHNNLGLSVGNALAAHKAGIEVLDCSVCGYARSAGNAPTEMLAVVFDRLGVKTGVNVFGLLDFVEKVGASTLKATNCVPPLDVVYGMAGFHSSFAKLAKAAAAKHNVSLHRLIDAVCKIDKINPSEQLFDETAKKLV